MLHLYVIDYFNQNNSGLTTYVSQLSDHLSRSKGICFHLLLVKATKYSGIQKERKQGITKYYVPYDIANPVDNKPDEQLTDYLKQETEGQERVLFHFNWINHAPFAQSLKKKIICKTVLTKHCIPWRDFITTRYPIFRTLNRQLSAPADPSYMDHAIVREWVSYQSVDHILCVTELAQTSLQRLFQVPLEKISVIQNGLYLKRTGTIDKNTLKQKYGFNLDEHIIFYAGAINERKGVFDLIGAFDKLLKKISNVRLVIAGEGDYRRIFQLAKDNWSKLTVTGFLDKKTLYDFYQMADVGVVPSYIEQCSYTTIEMMHHGLPVVVADVDGLAELVSESCGFRTPFVLGENEASIPHDQLEKTIFNVLTNGELSEKKALAAKKHALMHLTAKKMVKETIAVYSQVMDRAEKPHQVMPDLADNPLVSILLPCYNGEKYLKDCIESILGQTYSNFELIIIDDASTDQTPKLLNRYNDSRIIVLCNPDNQGIVNSLNWAVKLAKGKYIARIDIDDMMREDRIYKQVAYLEKEENSSVALVGSHHYVINYAGKIVGLKQYPTSMDEIRTTMLFQNAFSHPTVMMRAGVIKRIRYSAKYPLVEDYHLWFNIIKKHKAHNIPECLTYYRVHGENVSNQKARVQSESAAALLSKELDNQNIKHSFGELATHIAVSQGLRARFFNTTEQLNSLGKWLDRVFLCQQQKYAYPDMFLEEMKDHVKRFYCGIY